VGPFKLGGFKEFALFCMVDGTSGTSVTLSINFNQFPMLEETIAIGLLNPVTLAKVYPVHGPDLDFTLRPSDNSGTVGEIRVYAACCAWWLPRPSTWLSRPTTRRGADDW
jgi:hypothetical protein